MRLEQAEVDGFPGMFASVVTFGQSIDGDAKAILAEAEADPAGDGGASSEARDWLLDFLADGPRSVKELQAAARDAGQAWRTVKRVKRSLGVLARKSSMKGGWEWLLPGPEAEGGHESREGVQALKVGPLRKCWPPSGVCDFIGGQVMKPPQSKPGAQAGLEYQPTPREQAAPDRIQAAVASGKDERPDTLFDGKLSVAPLLTIKLNGMVPEGTQSHENCG